MDDSFRPEGRFTFDFYENGVLIRTDRIKNTIMLEGKNVMLDAGLAGSAYTVTGPYMGLISSVSFIGITPLDTGTQINAGNDWREAGLSNAPTYSGNRQTCVWSASSAGIKQLSAPLTFTFTGSGTVEGAFILYGSGALNTKDNAAGKLWSAGIFGGGAQPVTNTSIINVSYSVAS
jgi:hypothetical protein